MILTKDMHRIHRPCVCTWVPMYNDPVGYCGPHMGQHTAKRDSYQAILKIQSTGHEFVTWGPMFQWHHSPQLLWAMHACLSNDQDQAILLSNRSNQWLQMKFKNKNKYSLLRRKNNEQVGCSVLHYFWAMVHPTEQITKRWEPTALHMHVLLLVPLRTSLAARLSTRSTHLYSAVSTG